MNIPLKAKLSMLMFLQYFVWGSWFVTAGTYLMNGLDFSGREIGLVYGSSAIAACISPFIVGVIADKYFSLDKILILLQGLSIVFLWALSEIQSFAVFYPTIIVYMLIFLPASTLVNSICFHHLKDSRTEFPKIRVWGTIAWILAGLIVGLLEIETQSYPFKIAAVSSLVLFLFSFSLPTTKPAIARSKTLKDFLLGKEVKSLMKDKNFKIIILCVALICIPGSYYYSFVNPFLNDVGVLNAAAKMSIGQVSEIFVMLALPFLFRSFKLKHILFLGMFTWGFRYLLLSLGVAYDSEILYLISISLHGFAYVLAILSAQIFIDIKVPDELRSTAQGFFSFISLGIASFVGSFLAGETVGLFEDFNGSYNWELIWMIPAGFGFLVSFFFLLTYKPNRT